MTRQKLSSILSHGDTSMGQVWIYPQDQHGNFVENIGEEIRISHFSVPSKRCPPLVVLHSIASNGVLFKLKPKRDLPKHEYSSLKWLYNSCLNETNTAIAPFGRYELHLVAMLSRRTENNVPSFWGFYVERGLYDCCLEMLNLRCLALAFDLDETLIVGSTMCTFKDRIEEIHAEIRREVDSQKLCALQAAIKRCEEDQEILRQFIERDEVGYDGMVMKANPETVPPPSHDRQSKIRPIIRMPDRHTILTRIDPNNRDTSVLVRIRPFWAELRNYLTASNGRKRFEVFVCTMAEREYALEIWRLLDPEATLIPSREICERVVCVKSNVRKSLQVFNTGKCYPKFAMVLDDRLNVWEHGDRRRVHEVPAFRPYRNNPKAEETLAPPVLVIARNVACHVRNSFFKDLDELSERMKGEFFESNTKNLPPVHDVGNYLVEFDKGIPNGYPSSAEPSSSRNGSPCLEEGEIPKCDLLDALYTGVQYLAGLVEGQGNNNTYHRHSSSSNGFSINSRTPPFDNRKKNKNPSQPRRTKRKFHRQMPKNGFPEDVNEKLNNGSLQQKRTPKPLGPEGLNGWNSSGKRQLKDLPFQFKTEQSKITDSGVNGYQENNANECSKNPQDVAANNGPPSKRMDSTEMNADEPNKRIKLV